MTLAPHDARPADDAIATELAEAMAAWRDRGRLSNDDVRALQSRRRKIGAATAGTVAAVLIAAGLGQAWLRPDADRIATIRTNRGEFRTIRLPDKSILRLDGATSLSVRYGPTSRSVRLAGGAVYFDVAHDPTRPFTVTAGDGAVKVLGTAFEVDRTAGRMGVSVYRGAVRVAGQADTRGKWVPAGWRGHVVRGHAGVATRFDGRSNGRGPGWLDIDGLRLADLVMILNRRAGPEILAPPATLADLPVSGRFRTDDPISLIESLGRLYGFKISKKDNALIISRN